MVLDCLFRLRIKLYYFNDKEKKFSDRGIGNLFIKPTQKEGVAADLSYQLIIRADNKLAQILLNVKLSKVFPVTRDGPKDVSYLCVPNPPIQGLDSATAPVKFLFKVKTENDADELAEKLNEYKKWDTEPTNIVVWFPYIWPHLICLLFF